MTMWNMERGVMYRCEEQELVCNTFMNCMRVRKDQWEREKGGCGRACWKGVILSSENEMCKWMSMAKML
jgi:hypothetical protein